MLPVITVVAVGVLGGAVAVGVTTFVIIAVALVAILGAMHGLRTLGGFWQDLARD
jgi:hypothetical protein